MAEDKGILKESKSIIQEIENQLEVLLLRKKEEIEKALTERINREKENAKREVEQVEVEFESERKALSDYRVVISEMESERADIQARIKDHLRRILHFQAEIDNMAKATVEEIKKVDGLHAQLETLRAQTSERASFLKKDLREKFGIVAEVPVQPEPETAGINLDQELAKLRKIKELLLTETRSLSEAGSLEELAKEGDLPILDSDGRESLKIPEIQELIEETAARDEQRETKGEPDSSPEPLSKSRLRELVAEIEGYRKTEPANGSGEISYFQKEKRPVLDGDRLIASVEKTIEEAKKTSSRLELADSPKDQFFLKQELINWQEGLRRFVLRIVKLAERSSLVFPKYTAEVLNLQALKEILEHLSLRNWSRPEDLTLFGTTIQGLRSSFQEKSAHAEKYWSSLEEDLEAD